MKNRFLRTAASAVLTVLLVLTLLPQRALAAGATLTGTSALLPGDTVTLTLSVPSKVYGLSADLSYSGNLSLSNYNCSVSGWSIVMNNNKFSAYGTSSSSGGVVTIKMKVSSSARRATPCPARSPTWWCPTATATPIWAAPAGREDHRRAQRQLRSPAPQLLQRHPSAPPSPPRPPTTPARCPSPWRSWS